MLPPFQLNTHQKAIQVCLTPCPLMKLTPLTGEHIPSHNMGCRSINHLYSHWRSKVCLLTGCSVFTATEQNNHVLSVLCPPLPLDWDPPPPLHNHHYNTITLWKVSWTTNRNLTVFGHIFECGLQQNVELYIR